MKGGQERSSYRDVMTEKASARLLEQELLLTSATELVCQLMGEKNVSKSDLARRIGKSKAFVTQLLNGRRNMTLRTLADLCWALDTRLHIQASRDQLLTIPLFKTTVVGGEPRSRRRQAAAKPEQATGT